MLPTVKALPDLSEALSGLPLGPLREVLADVDSYVVGGVVRELVAGSEPRGDLDVAVDAALEPLLRRLEAVPAVEVCEWHERFDTASVLAAGARIDLTRTRTEKYRRPGALPEVAPAPIEADLARRDFTVNALAIPLQGPAELLDPFGGAADVRNGVLRILHDRSFVDDPTRAIRAARYASRLGLEPEERTLALLRTTDPGSVSAERLEAELARLADEPAAPAGFALLSRWGLLETPEGALELLSAVDRLAATRTWSAEPAARRDAILLAARGGPSAEAALRLAERGSIRPSEAVRLSAGLAPAELLLAAAAGCGWIAELREHWRGLALEIDGSDLVAAGIPEGPAVGAGLRAALDRKLDGELSGGREQELEAALAVAWERVSS